MNRRFLKCIAPLIGGAILLLNSPAFAQTDTLRLLSYNILYLGDTPPCQGPHSVYEGYLETIVAYANPDIAGFEKMEAIPMYTGDMSGNAPTGFADSLLQNSMNAAFPGRYAYCTYTNTSGADNISMLFYNQQKLGFAGILCSYVNITDFNTYKLYYKSPDLATTHDTIFLYVTLNHTNSGSGSSDVSIRETQIAGEMAQIDTHFPGTLPNMINMGDFNTHTSTEECYQTLVAPTNLNYRYYDPPFYPDATFSYPANWDSNPNTYASYLTVSTRQSGSVPNSCSGNSGGGKSWYDHIFLSANIINNSDHISYIPHSFRVIGNDGNRVGISVNGSPANTSAPATVINDIFQMSEHYPTALNLLVDLSTTSAVAMQNEQERFTVVNPVGDQLIMHFSKDLTGKTISIDCVDVLGRVVLQNTFVATSEIAHLPCALIPGVYYLNVSADNNVVANVKLVKQ